MDWSLILSTSDCLGTILEGVFTVWRDLCCARASRGKTVILTKVDRNGTIIGLDGILSTPNCLRTLWKDELTVLRDFELSQGRAWRP